MPSLKLDHKPLEGSDICLLHALPILGISSHMSAIPGVSHQLSTASFLTPEIAQ